MNFWLSLWPGAKATGAGFSKEQEFVKSGVFEREEMGKRRLGPRKTFSSVGRGLPQEFAKGSACAGQEFAKGRSLQRAGFSSLVPRGILDKKIAQAFTWAASYSAVGWAWALLVIKFLKALGVGFEFPFNNGGQELLKLLAFRHRLALTGGHAFSISFGTSKAECVKW